MESDLKKEFSEKLERRDFLKGVAVAGGAAALAAVGQPAVAGEQQAAATDSPAPSKGYQVTAHVKAYYDSLRI